MVTIEYSSGSPFGNINLQKNIWKDAVRFLASTNANCRCRVKMKDVGVECQRSILNVCHSWALSGWTMNQSASMIDKTLQYLLAAELFPLIRLTNVIPFSPMNFIRAQSVIHIMKTHRNWSKVRRANYFFFLTRPFFKLPQWLQLLLGFMHLTSTVLNGPGYEKISPITFLKLIVNIFIRLLCLTCSTV